jgi:TolB-like protein/class 3 adenylate cyclase/Flp pilus assembly protein TadD
MSNEPEIGVRRCRGVVVFADVVGYTRLMHDDEGGTWAALKFTIESLSELAKNFGGQIVQVRGDGLFLLFSEAIHAVEFANKVHEWISLQNEQRDEERPIRFRIGINIGDYIIDGENIIGDCVNIAARLQTLAKPGQVCISAAVYEEVRGKTSCGFGYLGLQSLKNIPDPVEVFEVRREAATATIGLRRMPDVRQAEFASDLSVVVLPFKYQGDDPTESWLADGLTEDITTNLSRFHELFVISRGSASVYGASGVSPEAAARDLRVRYAVSGAVRKAGSRLRISVELVDAERGKVIWGEQYKRAIDDLLDLQEEICSLIVAATAIQIQQSELERMKLLAPADLLAYGYVIKGQQHIFRYTREDNNRARRLYETALNLDPNYARALAAKSRTLNIDWRYNWNGDQQSSLDEALALAQAAINADPRDARGFGELGFAHLYRKEFDSSIDAYRRALSLNPNDADLMSDMADALAHSHRSEEAIALLKKAMQLNPFYPDQYLWHLGGAYFNLRRYDEAIQTLYGMQNPTEGRRLLAASYGHLGRIEEARFEATKLLRAHPNFSVEQWAAVQPDREAADVDHFVEGLRKAGL